jgi:hypothetical protein
MCGEPCAGGTAPDSHSGALQRALLQLLTSLTSLHCSYIYEYNQTGSSFITDPVLRAVRLGGRSPPGGPLYPFVCPALQSVLTADAAAAGRMLLLIHQSTSDAGTAVGAEPHAPAGARDGVAVRLPVTLSRVQMCNTCCSRRALIYVCAQHARDPRLGNVHDPPQRHMMADRLPPAARGTTSTTAMWTPRPCAPPPRSSPCGTTTSSPSEAPFMLRFCKLH